MFGIVWKRHSSISVFNHSTVLVQPTNHPKNKMFKFVLLVLACVTLVQGLMPMLRINKDINRIDFGDVQPTQRELRRQQRSSNDYGYAPGHGYYDHGYDHQGHPPQALLQGYPSPYPKFFAYYNAGGKRGGLGSRKNKGGVQYGLLLGR